jgi:hypothetical protein
MPSDDSIRLNEQEAVTPFGPKVGENDPQNAIGCPKQEPFLVGSLQNTELMAERKDFHLQ